MKYVTLNNNTKIPIIGMGTYPLNGFSLVKTVINGYLSGYASFETSAAYFNEKYLGISLKIIKLLGAKDIFVTTKLNNTAQREGDVRKAFLSSMKKLGLKKIDLYLMHWPYPEKYLDSWKEMELLYKEGLVKAIGVCNFHEHHLEKLLEIAEIIPAVNQVEIHPLLGQKPLRDYCESKGIKMQAYSPIARMDSKLIKHPLLVDLAKKHKKTVPQIILKWDIQNGIIAIPKSANKIRLKENINIFGFELSDEEMKKIDGINQNYRIRFNPDTADYVNILKA